MGMAEPDGAVVHALLAHRAVRAFRLDPLPEGGPARRRRRRDRGGSRHAWGAARDGKRAAPHPS